MNEASVALLHSVDEPNGSSEGDHAIQSSAFVEAPDLAVMVWDDIGKRFSLKLQDSTLDFLKHGNRGRRPRSEDDGRDDENGSDYEEGDPHVKACS